MQLQNSKHIGNEDQEEYFAQIGFSFTWNNELKLIEMNNKNNIGNEQN